jgi:hypothetical protein
MSSMNIKDILSDLPELPANISVMLRGDHGIGKSSLVRQIASKVQLAEGHENLPVIDRRLSQLTQGDIIGLPNLVDGRTRFNPPDWYVTACERPVVLFLDELNRAEPEVMQAAFQIVLDRELNGHRLHEQTRVYSAVNSSANYNVQQIDPALLDRFFVVDVNFTVEEWIRWARDLGGIHEEIIDFIQLNTTFLRPPATYDASQVQPSPRSWERVNSVIKPLLQKGAIDGNYDTDRIRRSIAGFCGVEAAMAFNESLKAEFKYTGEDILNRYIDIRDRIKRHRIDVMVSACEKLVAYCDEHIETITPIRKDESEPLGQGDHLKAFIWDLEKDHRVTLWQKLAKKGNARLPFIKSIHPSVAEAICNAFGVPIGPAGVGVLPNVHGAVQRAEDESKSA